MHDSTRPLLVLAPNCSARAPGLLIGYRPAPAALALAHPCSPDLGLTGARSFTMLQHFLSSRRDLGDRTIHYAIPPAHQPTYNKRRILDRRTIPLKRNIHRAPSAASRTHIVWRSWPSGCHTLYPHGHSRACFTHPLRSTAEATVIGQLDGSLACSSACTGGTARWVACWPFQRP